MIDWQVQFTFDNFFRFSIYRLGYSTLFMSTTMCSSACRRYEPVIVTVILSYFAVFSCYMYWLIYSGSHLHILVIFPPSLLCLYAFCIYFLSRFCSGLFCLFMRTLKFFFQRFFSSILDIFYSTFLIHFIVDFLYFSSSNIICYT